MGKIFMIIGKSATGKDTLYHRVVSELQGEICEITMYTTRPIRSGEVDGAQYFFVNEERYFELLNLGKIIEERAYNTIYGVWRYFTVDDGQFNFKEKNYIMMGTIEVYEKLKDYFGESNVVPIYVEVENGVRLERALARERAQREPKYTEMCRRFLADEQDFSEEKIEKAKIRKRYQNIDLEICLGKIIQDIRLETNEQG